MFKSFFNKFTNSGRRENVLTSFTKGCETGDFTKFFKAYDKPDMSPWNFDRHVAQNFNTTTPEFRKEFLSRTFKREDSGFFYTLADSKYNVNNKILTEIQSFGEPAKKVFPILLNDAAASGDLAQFNIIKAYVPNFEHGAFCALSGDNPGIVSQYNGFLNLALKAKPNSIHIVSDWVHKKGTPQDKFHLFARKAQLDILTEDDMPLIDIKKLPEIVVDNPQLITARVRECIPKETFHPLCDSTVLSDVARIANRRGKFEISAAAALQKEALVSKESFQLPECVGNSWSVVAPSI